MINNDSSKALIFLTFALQFFENLGLECTQSYLNLQLAIAICQWKRGLIKEMKQKLS